jgi:Zn-dependent peptidase ImmA (M78 family)
MSAFRDITAGSSQLTRRHVILLANMFGVAREAMVRRLEELRLAKPGTWDWFAANGGITDEQAKQVLGDDPREDKAKRDADRPVSLRLGLLAAEAWRRDLLSEAQLARLLHLDRVEVRQLVDESDFEGEAGDGPPRLPG